MIEIRNGLSLSIEDLGAGMTHCFEEYIVPINFTPALFCSMLRSDAIDMANTLIAFEDGVMSGILMVCRRGRVSRVGAMAVAKAHRGQGLGTILMDRVIQEARDRKDHTLVLEAVSNNHGAISFYERFGFRTRFALLGFTRTLLSNKEPENNVREIELDEMARLLFAKRPETCSWGSAAASVANLANPNRAFTLEGLGAVVVPAGEDNLVCRSLALSGEDDARKLENLTASLANQSKPQVAYRETVQTLAKAEGRFIRQTGGSGQYGHCWITMEPLPAGSGFQFANKVVGGSIPKEYIPAIEKGVREGLLAGVLAGYPVVDIQVTLLEGSYHEVDSNENAFKQAGLIAFKEAMRKANPILKEPSLYPGRLLKLPPFFPEPEFKEVLLLAGFDLDTLSQVQMELPL